MHYIRDSALSDRAQGVAVFWLRVLTTWASHTTSLARLPAMPRVTPHDTAPPPRQSGVSHTPHSESRPKKEKENARAKNSVLEIAGG